MTPANAHHRRATDRWYVRCFRFVTAPLVDGNTGRLSITRLLALADTGYVWHAIESKHEISAAALGVLVMAMAAAFGKSTFGFFLTKYEMKASLAATTNVTSTTTTTRDIKEILERRDPAQGFEATP